MAPWALPGVTPGTVPEHHHLWQAKGPESEMSKKGLWSAYQEKTWDPKSILPTTHTMSLSSGSQGANKQFLTHFGTFQDHMND